jgi:hypothetical protein
VAGDCSTGHWPSSDHPLRARPASPTPEVISAVIASARRRTMPSTALAVAWRWSACRPDRNRTSSLRYPVWRGRRSCHRLDGRNRPPSRLPSGTIHPILARLEQVGWLESNWEEADPREQGRPRRRYYRFSRRGAELARDALARAYQSKSAVRFGLGVVGEGATS